MSLQYRSFFVLFLLISTVITFDVRAASFDWKARINEVVQRHISEERNVGVIIGVIKNGETWIKGFGQTDLKTPHSTPSEDTIFEIGSISKVFTGLALGELVVDGKIRLEDSVAKHLPELAGTPAGSITLRELTTHTSGLPRVPSNLKPSDLNNPYKDYQITDLIAFLKDFQFEHSKPFPIQYSNTGVGLLGYILSRTYGDDYERMIRKLITRPLGMTDTGVTLTTSQLRRTAKGYNSILDENPLWDLSVLVPTGGIRASLHDMMIFLKANLMPDATPIASAIKLSHQVQAGAPAENVGLGWFIDGSGDDILIWHNGQTGGFHSLIAFKPKEQIGIVMLSNTASAVQCLSSIVFGKNCEPHQEYLHAEAQLQSFVGRYEFEPGFFVEITRHDSFLIAQLTGQSKLRLKADSEGQFDVGGGLAKITFVEDGTGSIGHLILSQDSTEYTAKRVTP